MRRSLLFLIVFFLFSKIPAQEPGTLIAVNAERLERHLLELAKVAPTSDGGNSRVAFSEADVKGRALVMEWMKEAGMEVSIDFAGNITGRREGKFPKRPPIAFGSHIDCVPNGGHYDGIVGSLSAIEVVRTLQENNIQTDHPLEVIIFSDEEGGLVGSRALIGELGPEAMEIVSHNGRTVREGIRFIGGDPDRLGEIERKKGDLKAFIELHIEQGGILESKNLQIGIVEGIVGIEWWDVAVEGFANHAGTTPMNMRRDALLAAARLIQAVNEVATGYPGSHVATIGRIKAEPGAPNVIPGKVTMSLEIRDLSQKKMLLLFNDIESRAAAIADQSGTTIRFNHIDVSAVPALTDKRVQETIIRATEKRGLTFQVMPSGAGHDAQNMARIAPTGMIFVPSVGGISHSPKEFTRPEDMANGANVLLETVLLLDRG